MDTVALINGLACLVLFVALAWLIMSPTVRDGVVIKLGLVSMALGELGGSMVLLGGEWAPYRPLMLCLAGVHVGAAVVLVGYLLRRAAMRRPLRRSTDWAALDHVREGW